MVTVRRIIQYAKNSFKLAQAQGMGTMLRALHRFYVNRKLPKKTRFLPTAMEVEITNRCNLNCIMCRGGSQVKKSSCPPQDMDMETFSKLLKKLKFLNLLSFRGRGEPLMNPQLEEMVILAKSQGIRVRISTNGMLLDAKKAETLLSLPIHEISISIDACNPHTYAKIRKGGDLNLVLHNLKTLAKLNQKQGRTKLMVMFVVMRSNYKELYGLYEKIKGLGVSRLTPRRLHVGASPEVREERLTPAQFEEVEKMVRSFHGSDIQLYTGDLLTNPQNARCSNLWESPFLTVDGGLSLCPAAFYNHDLSYGNLLEEDFLKIWNKKSVQKHRVMIAHGEAPFCKGCPVVDL